MNNPMKYLKNTSKDKNYPLQSIDYGARLLPRPSAQHTGKEMSCNGNGKLHQQYSSALIIKK